MKEKITLRTVLEECLKERNEIKRLCSRDYESLEPARGMEDEFYAEEQKCRILRELLQAIKSEPVRIALGDWENAKLKDWQRTIIADGVSYSSTDDIGREAFEQLIRETGEEQMRF